MSGDTFTCGGCFRTVTKGRPDEVSQAEADATFTPAELAVAATICDLCYRAFMEVLPQIRYALQNEAHRRGITYDALMLVLAETEGADT